MFQPILITIYILLFTFITWHRFNWGLFFLFLLLPTYLIRFNIGPLPTTLLEVMVWVILIIWLIRFKNNETMKQCNNLFKKHKTLFISIAIFLLAATISIFTSLDLKSAAGQWKAFYIEPFLIFLILITTLKQNDNVTMKQCNNEVFINTLIFGLILCGLVTSILAIYQHFTGWMVPYAFWENRNTFRVTGWYGFPNGVGLFLAPLFPLAVYNIQNTWKKIQKRKICNLQSAIFISSLLFLPTSILATFYAKSTGGLIGILAGIGILLLLNKKTRIPAVIVAVIGISSLLSFSGLSGIKNEIFMQDRSGQIRISMWQDTANFLKDNFIFGAGLASYEERIVPYHTTVNGEGIEIFHHPHNIFLTIWVNTGLLGLVSFILILIWFFKTSFIFFKNHVTMKPCNNETIIPFLIASLTTIIVTGLVDSPYIKNDLALLFWLLPALLLISTGHSKQDTVKS